MRKLKIVIIENDEDERFFIRQGFLATGLFDIICMLNNGENIINTIKQSQYGVPDFILTDLNMNGKDGFDILKEIKNTPGISGIPVIILSTASTLSIVEKSRKLGAYLYKLKPDNFMEYDAFARELYEEIISEAN